MADEDNDGVVADQAAAAKAAAEASEAAPTSEALHQTAVALMLDFVGEHGGSGGSGWVKGLAEREGDAWTVLAAAGGLGLTVDQSHRVPPSGAKM